VRRDTHVVCLHREEGAFPIRTHVLRAGDRHPLGVGAGSLAILSCLPDPEIEEMLGANAGELAARYPEYSSDVLHREVQLTRERGYALNGGLLQTGSWGVGVAVLNSQGRCEGALSIAAIETRLTTPRRDQMAALLTAEAQRLADRLANPSVLKPEKKTRGGAQRRSLGALEEPSLT
jgi:DNA-binding IclR family transcriptional regulator